MADLQAQNASYPNLGTSANGNASSFQNAKDSVVNNSQSAMNTIANHPVTQSVTNGPVAEKAREQANLTSNEFSNVAASRKTPEYTAATGQSLTHYHSMFYNILSWENPRVTGIAFAATVTLIFVTRYVPVLSLALKGSFIILGVISAAEVAGKLVFDRGLAAQVRPRRYYTIPRETLERSLEDVEQLVNFFVIEFQRVVFAENIYATLAAFASALVSYFLVKFMPKWGLALVATTVLYLGPLIYISNREFIDHHLNNASTIINEQTSQVRDLAAQHTGRASEAAKSTLSQYSSKAQELIGQAQNRVQSTAASPSAPNPGNVNPYKNEPEREIKSEDLPSAPTTAPSTDSTSATVHTSEAPIIAHEGEPIAL